MKFVSRIPRMDVILMGYWMEGQVSTMRSSITCKNKLRMWGIILRRIIMITCEMLWRKNLKSISSIATLGSSRGIVDCPGDAL